MKIAVLALQGAFLEHEQVLEKLGATTVELRKKEDLAESFDGLVLPGGESTVQGKLLRELDMFSDLRQRIADGLPVLATCAGLILLAENIEGGEPAHFGTLPVTVRRNAYGRQLGSFHATGTLEGIGEVPMTFIRAPYVSETREDVSVLGTVEGNVIAVRYHNQLALSFHPELDESTRIHEEFLRTCQRFQEKRDIA